MKDEEMTRLTIDVRLDICSLCVFDWLPRFSVLKLDLTGDKSDDDYEKKKTNKCLFLQYFTSIRSVRRLISFNCCSYCRIWFSRADIFVEFWFEPFVRWRSRSFLAFFKTKKKTQKFYQNKRQMLLNFTSSCFIILSWMSFAFFVSNVLCNELVLIVLFDRSAIEFDWPPTTPRNGTRPFWFSFGKGFCVDDRLAFGWPRRVNWAYGPAK